MKHLRQLLALVIILTLGWNFSCTKQEKATAELSPNEHLVMATLYIQTAAENRALCYQAFQLARLRLDEALKHKGVKAPAIVTDIDETLLDNSPYEAYCILSGNSYPIRWKEWVNLAKAKPVPGALEFLTYADQKGVDIFYISNRKQALLQGTMKNLKEAGFPQVREDHILLRTTASSKEARRQTVAATHEILLLLGDNLNDFAQVFEHKSVDRRFALADSLHRLFGQKFIVLPNPMYGEWEGALYDYHWKMSAQQKNEARKKALKGF